VGHNPTSAFAADLDGDGDMDVATTNASSGDISIVSNNGDGTFAPPSAYAVGGYPSAVLAADLDSDGDLDLAAANSGSGNVSILLKQISLVLSPTVLNYVAHETGSDPVDQSLDIESNGAPLAFVISESFDWFSPADTSGTTPATIGISVDIDGLAVGDYSGSMVTTSDGAYNSPQMVEVNLSVIPTSPSFIVSTTPAQNELNVPVSTDIAIVFDIDMDEATINDTTFVVNARLTGRRTGTITYDSPTKTAFFDPDSNFEVGELVTVMLTHEVQSLGKARLDRSYTWSFTMAVEHGHGVFDPDEAYSVGVSPVWVIAADLDRDGDPDLATANFDSDDISVLLNNGDATFAPDSKYPVHWSPECIFAADLDGDSDLDLATANGNASCLSVLLNNGDGSFGPDSAYWFDGMISSSVFAADLDGDGDLDLTATRPAANELMVLSNNGDGVFAPDSAYAAGEYPRFVCAADIDGNGVMDLVSTGNLSDAVSVLFNKSNGTLAFPAAYSISSISGSALAADLDGDGDLDLAVAAGTDMVAILLNSGDGTFAPHTLYPAGHGWPWSVFAADLDGDGDLDLATANRTSNDVSISLNNGDGSFASQTPYSVANEPVSVFAADLDGDGDLDLAVANQSSNNVSVLLNEYCCLPPLRGNVDYDPADVIDISDLVYTVDYMFVGGPEPDCFPEADIDGTGIHDISDLVDLVDYMFNGGPPPYPCP